MQYEQTRNTIDDDARLLHLHSFVKERESEREREGEGERECMYVHMGVRIK